MNTALLPTTSLAVEAELRAEAERCGHFQGIADNDNAGRYAYLFGLACSRLGEARREYLRLLERQAAKDSEALDVLERCAELLDDYSDVVDGDYGEPRPNRAMSLLTDVQAVLDKAGR